MRTSMRNTAKNVDEVFDIAQLCLNQGITTCAITNPNDVTVFLSSELNPYRVPGKNYLQFENLKMIPGIFLWVNYRYGKNVPILAYNFDVEQTHIDLENAFLHMQPEAKYLNSHTAISIFKKNGGMVFLATSNMHPFPDQEELDDIFAHHLEEFSGIEVYSSHFGKAENIILQDYAKDLGFQITGGDNYNCTYPSSMFGTIHLPETYETKWVREL